MNNQRNKISNLTDLEIESRIHADGRSDSEFALKRRRTGRFVSVGGVRGAPPLAALDLGGGNGPGSGLRWLERRRERGGEGSEDLVGAESEAVVHGFDFEGASSCKVSLYLESEAEHRLVVPFLFLVRTGLGRVIENLRAQTGVLVLYTQRFNLFH